MLEADYSAIGSAATGFEAAAQRLRDADVAGPLNTAQDALPGSATSEACLWVASRLGASVQVYADHVGSLSRLARDTVEDYRTTDVTQQQRYGGHLR